LDSFKREVIREFIAYLGEVAVIFSWLLAFALAEFISWFVILREAELI
jgi:hypothetical protein